MWLRLIDYVRSTWYAPTFSVQIYLGWMGFVLGVCLIVIPPALISSPPFKVWSFLIDLRCLGLWLVLTSLLQLFSAYHPKVCFKLFNKLICLSLFSALPGVASWALILWSSVAYQYLQREGWYVVIIIVYAFNVAAWMWITIRSPYPPKTDLYDCTSLK